MMDFITHGFRHCVIGVDWDSGLMESVRTRYMRHGESHFIHGMYNSILGLHNLDWNVFFFFLMT